MSELPKLFDIFFNGRPAEPVKRSGGVTIQELVKRGTSTVLVNGKLYRITCEKLETPK